MIKDIIIAVIILLVLFLVWAAVYDTNRFTVSNFTYSYPRIKKNFRAVVLSDLHNKSYGKNNSRLMDSIRQLAPDIILIAGDMVNGRAHEKTDSTVEFLTQLAKSYPVYYENGNHEMRLDLYRERFGDKYDRYCDALKDAGIHLLVNERECLDELGVVIIGSEINKIHYKRMGIVPLKEGELLKELGAPEKDYCNILLAHNPDFFEDYAEYGADIVFSGHVHGGIIRVPFINRGVLSPNVRFFPKYFEGEYREKDTTMIVSRGLGSHTIPFRLFNPGDLVVVDFSPNESSDNEN